MRLTLLLSVIGITGLGHGTPSIVLDASATCGAPLARSLQGTALRGGSWQFTRTVPPDPISNPAQTTTMSATKCIADVKALLRTQSASLEKFCKFEEPKKQGNTYVTTSVCDVPSMKLHVSAKNTTVVHDDSSYDSTIENAGTLDGKAAKWTEKVVAKRVGDCPGS